MPMDSFEPDCDDEQQSCVLKPQSALPAVVWPSSRYSEHPPGLVSTGQAYVAGIVDANRRFEGP